MYERVQFHVLRVVHTNIETLVAYHVYLYGSQV